MTDRLLSGEEKQRIIDEKWSHDFSKKALPRLCEALITAQRDLTKSQYEGEIAEAVKAERERIFKLLDNYMVKGRNGSTSIYGSNIDYIKHSHEALKSK